MSMHADEGVDVRLSTKLEGARGNGVVEELHLSGEKSWPAMRSWSASASSRDSEWLKGSGLPTDGVLTDGAGRTKLPHVFAAGDVARGFDDRVENIAGPSTGRRRPEEGWRRRGRCSARSPLQAR